MLKFSITGKTYLNLNYMYSFEMDRDSTLDVQSALQLATIARLVPNNNKTFIGKPLNWWLTRNEDIRLGQTLFSKSLYVTADNVFIQADLKDPATTV